MARGGGIGRVTDDPGSFVIDGIANANLNGGERLVVGSGDQQGVTSCYDSSRDLGDLGRCFSLSEHDLRETLSDRSMVVDSRETEIFERRLTHRVGQLGDGAVDRDITVTHPFKQRSDYFRSHSVATGR